jgi:hypothetical protein
MAKSAFNSIFVAPKHLNIKLVDHQLLYKLVESKQRLLLDRNVDVMAKSSDNKKNNIFSAARLLRQTVHINIM